MFLSVLRRQSNFIICDTFFCVRLFIVGTYYAYHNELRTSHFLASAPKGHKREAITVSNNPTIDSLISP
jgi:hypothetical protein